MSDRSHSHVSMMTDPIVDAELVLNLSRSPNKKKRNSPCRSIISYCKTFVIDDDNQITMGNTSSAR